MFALLAPASASAASATRIIVKRDAGLDAAERADIRHDAGVRLVRTMAIPRTEVVATTDPARALAELRRDRDVVYAQIDHVRRITDAVLPDDPGLPRQWGLLNTGQSVAGVFFGGLADADIDAPEAWGLGATGDQQVVAVIDTGVDGTGDLENQVFESRDFIGGGGGVPGGVDANSHGTHVAGIIAAAYDNSRGIAGVAPESQIMALKAIGDDGVGNDSDIADAIHYATTADADTGVPAVRVVNLSLGGSDPAPVIDEAIGDAPDTLFVTGAGNDGADDDVHAYFPCNSANANVICVGASTNRDRRAAFSNFGDTTVDLFAPGSRILSTVPPGTFSDPTIRYAYKDGTSMAAPHVAAAAALVMQAAPGVTVSDVKELLLATVDHRQAFAGASVSGGRLNAGAAVAGALADPGIAPADDDADGVIDVLDACPGARQNANGSAGCPDVDTDRDGVYDPADDCPGDANAGQQDIDHDGDGNVCDADRDGDGHANEGDSCPDTFGTLSNGCPKPVATPTPAPTPRPTATPTPTPAAADRDHDGRPDSADSCPTEPAATPDGCPLPYVTALSAKARTSHGKRVATIAVRTTRAATVRITVERKRGGRWVRVTRKALLSAGNRVTLNVKRLRKGSYRAVVVVSSSSGRAAPVTKRFRVR